MASPLELPRDTCAVCIGSGRFLRAVLVPLLQRASATADGNDGSSFSRPRVAVFQPRGTGFADACAAAGLRYEVDTIQRDGRVDTETVWLAGVGSLARDVDRNAFLALPQALPALRYVGVGITDAGFARGSTALRDLAQFLFACHTHRPDNVLSVINTDNVPSNGDLLRTRVLEAAWPACPARDSAAWLAFERYLNDTVHFHNTMVDRLTSHRPTDALVPLAEPWPRTVLAIQDSDGVLDTHRFTTATVPGVVVRATRDELLLDQKLKLRIANATSSALVYVLALARFQTNNEARTLPDVLAYRDALFYDDVLPSLEHEGVPRALATRVYDEWTHRSSHAHFGLVNLWVTQNAWLHFGARLFPSIHVNVSADTAYRVSAYMVFATASILRFLTPLSVLAVGGSRAESWQTVVTTKNERPVYIGAMDKRSTTTPTYADRSGDWVYGGKLRANLTTGEYEFIDAPQSDVAARLARVVVALTREATDRHDTHVEDATRLLRPVVVAILSSVAGFDVEIQAYAEFASDVASLYARMVCGRLAGGTPSSLEILSDVLRRGRQEC